MSFATKNRMKENKVVDILSIFPTNIPSFITLSLFPCYCTDNVGAYLVTRSIPMSNTQTLA